MRLRYLALAVALLAIGWYTYSYWHSHQLVITDYDSCITAPGSIIQESYPATCITRDGARFIQPIPQPPLYPGWQTYVDTQEGYFIQYPSDWSIEKACNGGHKDDNYICLKSPDLAQNPIPAVISGLLVIVAPSQSSYAHDNSDLSQFCTQSLTTEQFITCERLSMNGYHMAKKTFTFPPFIDVLIVDNQHPPISLRLEHPAGAHYTGTEYDQILQSFHFTD